MSVLKRLLGEWRLTMSHVAVPEQITGTQRYEAVLGGAFLLLRFTYDRPDFPDALALITEERVHYFDVRGVTRVFEVECFEDRWTLLNLDEAFSQRYTARFVGPDEVHFVGEASHDSGARWQPDFEMTLQRVT